jgi:hypothetical protein
MIITRATWQRNRSESGARRSRKRMELYAPILKARLGDSAGVAGTAYLALKELGRMTF